MLRGVETWLVKQIGNGITLFGDDSCGMTVMNTWCNIAARLLSNWDNGCE